MAEPVIEVASGWSVVAALLVGALVLLAAVVDGAATAVSRGLSLGRGVRAPLSELARLMRQRRRSTLAADSLLWRAGVSGIVVVALLMVAVVPLGQWTVADLVVGVVWFNAMDVVVWALVWLAGWGPNATHSLVGGYRFLAQALAYELPLMFALVGPAVAAESLRVGDVVAAQDQLWFVVWMPVSFLVFGLGVVGFSVWGPLSPALGADIAGGVLAELSGPDRLLVLVGRYALLAAGAAFAAALFLGGGTGPLLPAWLWMLLKTAALLALFVLLRRRLPSMRPDRFVEVGWLVLLPLVLLQLLVVSVVVLVGRS